MKENHQILIVEDKVTSQIMLLKELKRFGYHADIVNSGVDALEAVMLYKYDVVFIDLFMSTNDGFKVAKTMRKLQDGKDLKIFGISTLKRVDVMGKCEEAGINDCLNPLGEPLNLKDILGQYIPG
jgi:CheY-like chemotaxis protein